jgi:hypothetical protein
MFSAPRRPLLAQIATSGSVIWSEVRRVATAARVGAALLAPASLPSLEWCFAAVATDDCERTALSRSEVEQRLRIAGERQAGIGAPEGAFGKGGCVFLGAGVCAASCAAGLEIALGGALAKFECVGERVVPLVRAATRMIVCARSLVSSRLGCGKADLTPRGR